MTRRLLTEQDIVDRAARRKLVRFRVLLLLWCGGMLFVMAGFAFVLYEPVHALLRVHVEFFWGVLAGSLLQSIGWLRDRWRWMKWFSL